MVEERPEDNIPLVTSEHHELLVEDSGGGELQGDPCDPDALPETVLVPQEHGAYEVSFCGETECVIEGASQYLFQVKTSIGRGSRLSSIILLTNDENESFKMTFVEKQSGGGGNSFFYYHSNARMPSVFPHVGHVRWYEIVHVERDDTGH
jgi:hypothetical protein